ncbi:MAG: cation:H+ antiporter [Acidimicrobiaceae bacterium]|jgi:cation:H+ antiporter
MQATSSNVGVKIGAAFAVALPAVTMRVVGVHPSPEFAVVVFGAAVVATAFLLAWAAEAAQLDISGSLATALLALIAVLPEYAVDLYFSYSAGSDPTRAQFAAANMTGSNRLLIGIGWPLVAFVAFAAYKRRRPQDKRGTDDSVSADEVHMQPVRRIELGFLAIASAYAFIVPFTRTLAWYDSVVLLSLFGLYLWRVAKEEQTEPELIGVSAALGELPQRQRRIIVPLLFLAAAAIVLASAEPFANGLVDTGARLGVDQFLLVQWLAPLASEAPELIVASLFAWRLRGGDALGTLLSSKVNQWTLLVGSLPLAYLAGGGGHGLPLDARQTEEFFLTSAQALLALAIVIDLRFNRREAAALLALFVLQFPFPSTTVRLAFSALYMICAVGILIRRRREIPVVARALLPTKSDNRSSPK